MNFHVAVIKIVKELALKLRVFLVAKLKISSRNKKLKAPFVQTTFGATLKCGKLLYLQHKY